MPKNAIAGVDRRQFLQAAVAGVVAGLVAPSAPWLAGARALSARRALTPDEALRQLLDGNARFAASRMTAKDQDLALLRKRTAEKQEPFAAVLACADSRVPVELVFDQSIGQIFVARVAGNIVTPEIMASLEYAVAALGVRAILVLGHSNCGAVKAAMKTEVVPGQISALYSHIRPAVDQSAGNVGRTIETNARIQAELLRTSSTVIRQATAAQTIGVTAGVYDLATGKVTVC